MSADISSLLCALLRAAVRGEPLAETDKTALTPPTVAAVLTLAKQHDVTHLAALALEKNGLPAPAEVMFEAVYRHEQLDYALAAAATALETAAVPFIPLKGAVLRAYYPEPWLRTSVDIDILVPVAAIDRATAALVDNGFTHNSKGSHDIQLSAPNGWCVELHYALLEDTQVATDDLLARVWDTALPQEGNTYARVMADEVFYLYHIAHMAKHILDGGCGIRPLLDLWLLDTAAPADNKRDALLRRYGLDTFAAAIRKLSRVWFDGEGSDDMTDRLAAYILRGGAGGTVENRITLQTQKQGSRAGYLYSRLTPTREMLRLRYPVLERHGWLTPLMWVRHVLSRLFAPYHVLKARYPILQKHKWLTPLMQVRRWGRLLFTRRGDSEGQSLVDHIGL